MTSSPDLSASILPPQGLSPDAIQPYYDTVILGAGPAGIAAARQMLEQGHKNILIVEARDRIGGRTQTDPTFGDLGAAWNHINDERLLGDQAYQLLELEEFFINKARKLGFTLSFDNQHSSVYLNGHPVSREHYFDAVQQAYVFLKDVQQTRGDMPISELVEEFSQGDEFRALAMYMEHAWAGSGCDLAQNTVAHANSHFSCASGILYKEGLGRLILELGQEMLPYTALNTQLTSLHTTDTPFTRIGVVTANGEPKTIYAKQVLNTIPPPVFTHKGDAHEIKHNLPAWKTKAMEALPSGAMNKIILQVSPDYLKNMKENSHFEAIHRELGHMFFLAKPGGMNLVVGFVGGEVSKQLEANPSASDAARSYALKFLSTMPEFHDIASHVRNTHYTTWFSDPYSRGSFSIPIVNAGDARADLAAPIDDKIFFAGEACAHDGWQTHVGGAWLTGTHAAQAMLASLRNRSDPSFHPLKDATKIWTETVKSGDSLQVSAQR